MLTNLYRTTLACMFILFCACQKEICYEDLNNKPPLQKYPVPGGWLGKFGQGNDAPNLHFAALFKPEGTVTIEADALPYILFGNWNLVGDSLKTSYAFPGGEKFEFAAKYSETVRRIEGYWKALPPTVGGGKFYLEKIN